MTSGPLDAETRLRAALTVTDKLTRAVVDALPDIEFRVASTESELDAVFRARYEIALEAGWITPADFPDGRDRDRWDDAAVHVTGWDGDSLVAASRLVFPAPEQSLPTE